MSNEAITWALGQKVDRSTAKFVLVAMANLADNDMTCYPSVQYLSDATCQDRKTVLENIKRLKDSGHISDTGRRKGATGQVVVYQLNSAENGTVKTTNDKSAEEVTVPKTDDNSPVFPVKESRFSVVTVPKTGHEHHIDTSIDTTDTKKKRGKAADDFDPLAYLLANEVELQVAKDWLRHRKTKKSDVSKTVVDGHIREAAKAGMALQAALVMACERGWVGFKAEWVAQQARASPIRPEKFDPIASVNRNRIRQS